MEAESVKAFCRDPFWNSTLSWNTTRPQLTDCFKDHVLIGVPCFLLWFLAPFWVHWIFKWPSRSSQQYPRRRKKAFTLLLKIASKLFLIISTCLKLYRRVEQHEDLFPGDVFGLALLLASYIFSVVLTALERVRHVHSSPLQFHFWLIHTLLGIPQFYEDVIAMLDSGVSWPPLVSALSGSPMTLAIVILHSISDEHADKNSSEAPQLRASHFSNIFFTWMDGLITKGYKNSLIQSELPKNPEYLDVSSNVKDFLGGWHASVSKMGVSMVNKSESQKIVSIWPVLFKTYGLRMFLSLLLGVVHTLITFVNPMILDLLISHVTNKKAEEWKGYLFIMVLLLSNVLWTLSFHIYIHHVTVVGLQIRSSAISAIFRKSLKLSNKARAKFTTGEIQNFMSVDAQRLLDSLAYIPNVLLSPILIVLALIMLYQQLQLASLGSIGILLILVPINVWGTRKCEQMQESQMQAKDERIKLMNEVLPGMKVIKLFAWENAFMKRVNNVRESEVSILRYLAKLWALTNFTYACSPFLVTVVVFFTYTMIDPANNVLDASKIFVSLAIFGIMRLPLVMFPWALTESVQFFVSVKRINKFLNAEELDPDLVGDQIQNEANVIEIKNASLAWGEEEEQLKEISLDLKQGSLTAIVGQVGSGKSSLLSAILGEMDLKQGSINKKSKDLKVAYVAQQGWIQNLSLKDNILFDQPFNERWYGRTVEACALKQDLEMLPGGDETEIGENGINLSGGQKQRVSIARAVYSDSDVYIMDDPLSAVDAHVGKHIFDKVISSTDGILKDKTRILATNSLPILKHMDQVIVMRHGRIEEKGTYKQLLANKGAFAEYLAQHLREDIQIEKIEELDDIELATVLASSVPEENMFKRPVAIQRSIARTTSTCLDSVYGSSPNTRLMGLSHELEPEITTGLHSPEKNTSRRISLQTNILQIPLLNEPTSEETTTPEEFSSRLIDDETALTGRVKWGVYKDYAKSVGLLASFACVFLYILGSTLHASSSVWLSYWSDFNGAHNGSDITGSLSFFLGTYAALGGCEALIQFFRDLVLFLCCAKASKVLHQRLLYSIMRSPMSFFDTNPTGRIVNRFSADIDKVDLTIPFQFSDFLFCACEVVATLIIISYSTPNFLFVIAPLFIVYALIQRFYIKSSRQLKRLEAISKSPYLSHFTETVNGAATIRAYGHLDRFIEESEGKVAANVCCNYYNYCSNRWLGIRIETLGSIIIFFAALFAIISRDTLSPGRVGLSISYAMQVTDTLTWMVRMICDLETNCVAIERILEYINGHPHEAKWESSDQDVVPKEWPHEGKIELVDYQTRYRDGLDLVLKGINLTISKQMKVGVCGRTGAGKSSLTLSLFRIIEPVQGQIVIDGKDVSELGLHDLRSRLTIIPQDPVLFTGNVRFNLDPTEKCTDDAIWTALEHAHLKAHVETLEGGLDHEVNEGGSNFSVGQRQLLCLARALLRKTKILVLDEATAAIDMETDHLIQKTIRREFQDCTVITIAHRLNTIMDSDKIVVLSHGRVVEFDSPAILLSREDSALRSMAKDANILF